MNIATQKKTGILFSYFGTQPREVGLRRKLSFSRKEMVDNIRSIGFKSSVYVSLYHFSKLINFRPDYSSAFLDKVFFDIDNINDKGYENMIKFHEYFLKNKIKHFVVFSGEGFHVYAITDCQNNFVDKSRALKNYQIKVCEDLGLSWKKTFVGKQVVNSDVDGTSIFGDLARIVRLPNTFNPRRKRFCFILNKDLIDNYENILYEAMPQHFNPKKHEGEMFNSEPISLKLYDVETKKERLEYDDFKDINNESIEAFQIEEEVQDLEIGWCHHVSMMLKQRSGRDAWFTACLWLRENGFSKAEVNEILKRYLTQFKRDDKPFPNDYLHAIYHDRILETIFGPNGDKYLFPTYQTLIERGLTNGTCGICEEVYLHRRKVF